MKNALIAVALALVAWFAYTRAIGRSADQSLPLAATELDDTSLISAEPNSQFSCDGRTHCSQMTSCAEAEYFLRNCPGVEMDGNSDGEPCEGQWCGNSQ
jgi:hypothetical protein